MNEYTPYLLAANEAARVASATGNMPFGAVLADAAGNIVMTQGNAEKDAHDATAHAERMLATRASMAFDRDYLWKCTLYSTFEPCPMCMGAIYWANIGRVVFGLRESTLLGFTGDDEKNPTFSMGAQNVIDAGQKPIVLIGPAADAGVEAEIAKLHRGFWNKGKE